MNNSKMSYIGYLKVAVFLILLLFSLTGCSPYKNSRYIELAKYMDIELEHNLVAVTDEDMQKELSILLDKYAETYVYKEGEVQQKDIANIDYSGTIDGNPFEGGAANGYDLEIGSNSFIPGFEEGLIGTDIGQSVTLNLVFPTDYKDEDNNISKYAGKDVQFTVKINEVERRVPPIYNDDFVKSLNKGYDTIEQYNEYLENEIYNFKKTQTAWKIIVDNTVVKKYPSIVEKRVETIREYYEYYMSYYGYTTFNEFCLDALGQTEEEFDQANLESARDGVKQEMIAQAIAHLEGIKLSDTDLLYGYDNYAEYYGYENTEDFLKDYDKESITNSILLNKVMEYVSQNAVIVKD